MTANLVLRLHDLAQFPTARDPLACRRLCSHHILRRLCAVSALLLAPSLVVARSPDCLAARAAAPCANTLTHPGQVEPGLYLGFDNPVHLGNGYKSLRDTDLPALAQAPGLELVRLHHSADRRRTGTLGPSWHFSYDVRLTRHGDTLHVQQADGTLATFDCRSDAPHCAHPQYGALQSTSDGWQWRWPDGSVLPFRLDGWLMGHQLPDQRWRYQLQRTGDGRLLHVRDPQRAQQLTFHYRSVADAPAQLRHIDTPAGRFHYHYAAAPDGQARLQTVTRPDGLQRHYAYAPAGHADSALAVSATGLGRLGAPVLWQRRWRFDRAGRVMQLTLLGSDQSPLAVWQLRYPAPGLTEVHGPHGVTRVRHRQHQGRYQLLRVTGAPCPGCPAPGLSATYDAAGRLTQVLQLRVLYDASGRWRHLHVPDSGWGALVLHEEAEGTSRGWTSPQTGSTYWRHARRPAAGMPQQTWHYANGDHWQAWHDADGLPQTLQLRRGLDGQTITMRVAWHKRQPIQVQHPAETETRRYDAQGRLHTRTLQRPGPKGSEALRLQDTYHYDVQGRLIRHQLPEGGQLVYTWRDTQLLTLAWQDPQGRSHVILRTRMDQPGYEHGNGVHTTALADANGLRALISQHPDAPTPALAQSLFRDRHGRLIEERLQTGDWQQTLQYGYDAAGRLAHIRHNGQSRYLAWHADGRLRASWPDTPVSEAFDASGLPQQRAGWQLRYDAQRRLQRAVDPRLARTVAFQYNARGERIRRTAGAHIEHYVYQDGLRTVVAQPPAPGRPAQVRERYVYAGALPVAWLRYGIQGQVDLYFIHADAQGLPRALSDVHGQLVWRGDFDAFGRLQHEDGAPRPALRYPGQYADDILPWHDNGQRTYDPSTGDYLEPDPLGPQPGLSAYGYAEHKPRQYADPSGLLLYAFDGTRNTPASLTNVWLLHQLYPDTARYLPGPGRDHWDAATAHRAGHLIHVQWERLLADLATIQRAADMPATTPIDLLGYSRGAALAQHFANQIAAHVDRGRFWAYDPALGTVSACVDLRFMGLFDTVAQFGLNGRDNRDYLLGAPPVWRWIAHAVALHERRQLFPLNALAQGQPNVVERPFIGAHADIGGGYLAAPVAAAARGDLSDIALAWMHWQARVAGVPLAPLPEAHARVTLPRLHDERPAWLRWRSQDRPAHQADGRPWLARQGEHAELGDAVRAQVEPFLRRLPDWLRSPANVVAVVDMDAYWRWLAARDPDWPLPATP